MAEAKNFRLSVRIKEAERRLLYLFGYRLVRDIEYDFAYRNILNTNSEILDVGGCGSLFPLILAKKGHRVTVYDFRTYPEKHQNLKTIKGSFLDNQLSDRQFDYIILISCIEHIGLGSYNAPLYEDGDWAAVQEIKRTLKTNGKAILTFPFTKEHTIIEGFERWYDIDRTKWLFSDLYILKEEYWIPEVKLLGHWIRWRPGTLHEAQEALRCHESQGLACFVISINPPNSHDAYFCLCSQNKGV